MTDLSAMGIREREEAIRILTAWNTTGLPEDFNLGEIQFGFNADTGNVFLTNEEGQACVEVDGELYSWYVCPECGIEGTQGDFSFEFCEDCNKCGRCDDCACNCDQ